jgi:LPS-assembly lipoprotein
MSLFERRHFLLISAALAGCGFTPAYGPNGGAAAFLGRVTLASPRSRDEFALARRLSERLGPAEAPAFLLEYDITTAVTGQAITPDNATTRYSLTAIASYRLTEIATAKALLEGDVSSFTSWSATGTTVASLAAEEDAHFRLMRLLADQIVTRLLAAAGSLAP